MLQKGNNPIHLEKKIAKGLARSDGENDRHLDIDHNCLTKTRFFLQEKSRLKAQGSVSDWLHLQDFLVKYP